MPNLSGITQNAFLRKQSAVDAADSISALSSVGTLAAASVPNATAKRRLAFGGATLRTGKKRVGS